MSDSKKFLVRWVLPAAAATLLIATIGSQVVVNWFAGEAETQGRAQLSSALKQVAARINETSLHSKAMAAAHLLGLNESAVKDVAKGVLAAESKVALARLAPLRSELGAFGLYIVNRNGQIVAQDTALNRTTSGNVAARPYFVQAMKGRSSVQMDVGSRSAINAPERGLYLAAPIYESTTRLSPIIGVILIGLPGDTLDFLLAELGADGLMISPQGVVMAATREEWLWQLSAADLPNHTTQVSELKHFVRQFAETTPTRLAFNPNGRESIIDGARYAIEQGALDWNDAAGNWQLVAMRDTAEWFPLNRRYKISFVVATTIIAFGLMVIAMLVIRRKARRNVRRFNTFDAAMSTTSIGVVFTDANGLIEWVNPEFERNTGYTLKEAIGKKPSLVASEATEDDTPGNLWAALSQGQSWRGEFINRRQDGSIYWDSSTISPVRDEKGTIIGYVGLHDDITESKMLQAKLASVAEDLEHAKSVAESASLTKSEFLANMSHEIRTPMNGILGMLKLLQHTDLTPRQLDYTVKAHTAAKSLLGIINDILDFSKVEAGKMVLDNHSFGIDQLMRELSEIVSANLNSDVVEILFSIDPRINDALIGDSLRLKQVMLNLTNNAVKFTEAGEVVVTLKLLGEDEQFCEIECSVKDSGIGIPADKLRYIFEGFSQAEASTARRFGGTGLGLAISQRLVALMGGKLQLESELGKGSRFFFTLRLQKSHEALVPRKRNSPSAALPAEGNRQLRVLIVDDNDVARELMKTMATPFGWQIDAVTNGQEALDRTRQMLAEAKPYNVIFMDWKMPDMDGWETTGHLRRLEWPDDPPVVIMVTSHSHEQLVQKMQAEPYAMDGFIVKPVTASMLFDAVMDATAGLATTGHRIAAQQGLSRLTGLRLMVVDDNLINQQIASELLTGEGAIVTVASGGLEAVQKAVDQAKPFDAVLMDIQMPDIDGYEATRRILRHDHLATMPIIAMTANAMESDKKACLDAGMVDHVGKPIDLDILVTTLRQHCDVSGVAATESAMPVAISEAKPEALSASISAAEIETTRALKRLGGKRNLYLSIVTNFKSQAGSMAQELHQHLQDDLPDTAVRIAHTLRGVAAATGATRVANDAEALELVLKAKGSLAERETLLADLESSLAIALTALDAISQDFSEAKPAINPSATVGGPLQVASILAFLNELEPLLQGKKMRATRVFSERMTSADPLFAERLKPLELALSQLDFKLALAHCRQLREAIQ